MKTLTDFALKEEYTCLQSVGDIFIKFVPYLIGNLFVPFLSPYILTKQFQKANKR